MLPSSLVMGLSAESECALSVASLLTQNGESLAYVKEQLGHYSIKLTVDTYGHLIPGANREAVNRLDDVTFRNSNATGALQKKRG